MWERKKSNYIEQHVFNYKSMNFEFSASPSLHVLNFFLCKINPVLCQTSTLFCHIWWKKQVRTRPQRCNIIIQSFYNFNVCRTFSFTLFCINLYFYIELFPLSLYHFSFTLYPLPFTLYPIPFTLYPLHFTLYTLQFALYTLHFTLNNLHFTIYSLYNTFYTLHFTLYALHFELHIIHFTLNPLRHIGYTKHFSMYTMYYTLYTIDYTFNTKHMFIL